MQSQKSEIDVKCQQFQCQWSVAITVDLRGSL